MEEPFYDLGELTKMSPLAIYHMLAGFLMVSGSDQNVIQVPKRLATAMLEFLEEYLTGRH